tara:strand:+ start:484 stop:1176 length:693 start_codon:yes stop_codon:yes gene_type:complete
MDIELITAEVCPFAQRSHMCLLEKGLAFVRHEVDLNDKPAWFLALSPYGKVPVLKEGENRIFESGIINEYLEDAYPKPNLLPVSASGKAEARIWIDFDNTQLVSTHYRMLLSEAPSRRTELVDKMRDLLLYLEREGFGAHRDGPFWFGDEISLVDLALYPHFERFCVLTHYRGARIPDACARVRDWLEAMRERPSAIETAHDEDYHISAYASYAAGTADGSTARDMRESV